MPFINRVGSGATRKFGFGAGMKPDAPTIGTATRGDLQASVAFTEPSNRGTGTPTYTATSSPGGFTASGAGSPLVVTGLANGTAYTFTVTASNAFGSSTSAASNSVTPAGVPATPAAPTPTAGNGQVSLSWTAPSDNGSAITDYLVYYATSAGGSYTLFSDGVSTTASTTVTSLTNGTAYYFKIIAVNAVGNSALSAASTSATPVVPPPPPPPPCSCCTAAWDGVTYSCVGTLSYEYWTACCPGCPGEGGYNPAYRVGKCGYTAPACDGSTACGNGCPNDNPGQCFDFGFGCICFYIP
jgi:hypothetical protein